MTAKRLLKAWAASWLVQGVLLAIGIVIGLPEAVAFGVAKLGSFTSEESNEDDFVFESITA
jgi:hypothetical protein